MIRRLVPILLALGLIAGVGPAANAASPPTRPAYSGMVADYAAPVRESTPRADGQLHVDTPATIAKLKALHVTDYFYLVWQQASDWDDLSAQFLPAAEKAGIKVWVYLVPPSEGPSQPFGSDYLKWVTEIAQLSTKFPDLRGWAMDDFARGTNLETFTPAFFQQAEKIIDATNPKLQFLPIAYYTDITAQLLATYQQYFDGLIFPYSDFTSDYAHVDQQIDHVAGLLAPYHKKAYLMLYGSPHSATIDPMQADYYTATLDRGIDATRAGKLAGIVMYQTPKAFQTETCTADPDNHHLDLVADWGSPTAIGDFANASQQITVDPTAAQHQITFWERDSYYHRDTSLGYHIKQLLVNGTPAWQADAASDAQEWQQITVDLTPYLTAGATTATLTFQLYEQNGVSNFGLQFLITDVAGTGVTVADPNFSGSGWTTETSANQAMHALPTYYVCDPDRQQHAFTAIADVYGPYELSARAAGHPALVILANRVVSQFRSGDRAGAAKSADLLAAAARALRQNVLAEQAQLVANDLRTAPD
jgi:hypothetical protein